VLTPEDARHQLPSLHPVCKFAVQGSRYGQPKGITDHRRLNFDNSVPDFLPSPSVPTYSNSRIIDRIRAHSPPLPLPPSLLPPLLAFAAHVSLRHLRKSIQCI
jgi:hypothetical protein